MKRLGSRIIRRVMLLSGTALAAASPVTVEGGLGVRLAHCQDGTCCPEEKATCIVGDYQVGGYYYKSAGSCKDQAH